jgi:3-phenylpropionate/trans-cinnamate dioxygenase ferredoxin subunit
MPEVARVRAEKVEQCLPLRLEAGTVGVCLVRIGDDFYALADQCSHEMVPLSEGDVDPEECSIECWKHGSTFSLRDGQPQALPATHSVRVYHVSREGEDVVVSEP